MTTAHTHLDIALAAARYAQDGDFRRLRLAVAGPRNREQSPYYYSINTGVRQARAAGTVALRVRDAAVALGMPHEIYPSASWSHQWPRTMRSIHVEGEGMALFAGAIEWCARVIAEAEGQEVSHAA